MNIPLKIVISPDSFKGSLTAVEVTDAIESGILSVCSDANVVKLPLADGGEGTMETLVSTLNGSYVVCQVPDPLGRLMDARYGIAFYEGVQTAVIELAAASGLPLLKIEERNPLYTSTRGTGCLIVDALARGCRRIMLGIGGSATNDAGKGMMEELGVRFLDVAGKELAEGGASLKGLETIDMSNVNTKLAETQFTIFCDVKNPLYGPMGAACVFAPQKGASLDEVKILDEGLRRYASVIATQIGKDVASFPGAGAAGGVGAAFMAFTNASLCPGIDTILNLLHFEKIISGADLIVTGEGRADRQTLMGKVPYGVLKFARLQEIPVVVLAGAIEDGDELLEAGFLATICIQSKVLPLNLALEGSVAAENLRKAAIQMMRLRFLKNK